MLKKFIITIALLCPLLVKAQESPNVVVGPVSSQQKAAEKKKEKQKVEAEKAEKKGVKQQIKIQDKQTRKRMKQSRKEADRINNKEHKKGFFLFRPFKKKHH